MIIVATTLIAKPGKRDEVIALTQECIAKTRQEKGCISYSLYKSTEDDVTLHYFEEWENLECLRAHAQSAHLNALKEARKPLTEGPSRPRVFEAKEISL